MYDITQLTPEYVTRLRFGTTSIMQSFGVDPANGEIYVSYAGANHNLVICRCTPDGNMIDQQTLIGGGHGANLGLARDGENVYFWSWWEFPGGHDAPVAAGFPYRWKWSGSAYAQSISYDDPTVEPIPNLDGSVFQNITPDPVSDRVVIRSEEQRAQTDKAVYILRKLSELQAGVGDPIATIVVQNQVATYGWQQGQDFDGDYLYAAFGGGRIGNTGYKPPVVVRADWATGGTERHVISMADVGPQVGADGSYIEIEGVFKRYTSATEYEIMVGMATKTIPGVSSGVSWLFTFKDHRSLPSWATRALSSPVDTELALTDTNNFTLYDANAPMVLRKINGMVTLAGELKLLTANLIDGATGITVAQLPPGFDVWGLSRGMVYRVPGMGQADNKFQLAIRQNGNVNLSQYGPAASAVGDYLGLYATWAANE